MDLIVGVNSYMTLEEANNLVASMFLSSSKERTLWSSLSDDDKAVLIIDKTSEIDIDQMLYIGKRTGSMQWPRIKCCNNEIINCPDSIKRGLLLQLFNDYFVASSEESNLINLGVKSFADGGGARIEFFNKNESISDTYKNSVGISKKIWRSYFSPWSLLIG